jgi:hypothetical protein
MGEVGMHSCRCRVSVAPRDGIEDWIVLMCNVYEGAVNACC